MPWGIILSAERKLLPFFAQCPISWPMTLTSLSRAATRRLPVGLAVSARSARRTQQISK